METRSSDVYFSRMELNVLLETQPYSSTNWQHNYKWSYLSAPFSTIWSSLASVYTIFNDGDDDSRQKSEFSLADCSIIKSGVSYPQIKEKLFGLWLIAHVYYLGPPPFNISCILLSASQTQLPKQCVLPSRRTRIHIRNHAASCTHPPHTTFAGNHVSKYI